MKQSPVQAIDRAFAILELVAMAPEGLKANDIASALGLKPTTVHGLLRALIVRNALEHDPLEHTYRLGYGIFALAQTYDDTFELRIKSEPLLRNLQTSTGETVNIGVLRNFRVFTLLELMPERSLSARELPLGGAPPHLVARGKVLLAALDSRYLELMAQTIPELTGNTPHTITDYNALQTELEKVRQVGYARNMEESSVGVCGFAVPVYRATTVVASIGLALPLIRWSAEHEQELIRKLQTTAKELGALLQ